MRTRVKFCGFTRVDDVRAAAALGVDAIGLIFAAGSPRRIDIALLDQLLAATPLFITPVALFRDNDGDEVERVLCRSSRLVAQFHGQERPAFCAGFNRSWLKAVPMHGIDALALPGFLQSFVASGCSGFVFDSHGGAGSGGSGRTFDWSRVPRDAGAPVVLAGGLNPENVCAAVRQLRPYAVDVASGIESAPGVKDHAKMQRFIEEVSRARTD